MVDSDVAARLWQAANKLWANTGPTYGTYGNKVAIEGLRPLVNRLGWKGLIGEGATS